ncbi:hypothetical protein HUJ05_005545 [Dendroctonus ponderosae]|nr:hypothetical protein HUJ05_005545 [Dendroctonus ponderosae]
MERSCMCCQESGEREASVSLFCPKAKPGERKFIKTKVMKNLAVFDFDHTIVDTNSDTAVMDLVDKSKFPPDLRKLHKSAGWTAFMQAVFNVLHENQVTEPDIAGLIRRLPGVAGIKHLIQTLHDSMDYDVIIISDANTYFINAWLEENGLSSKILKVYSNPGAFNEQGRLEIEMFHDQDSCQLSTRNLCKGQIMQDFIKEQSKRGIVYRRVVYVGDGHNDFCPILRLGSTGVACCRKAYQCADLVQNAPNTEHRLKAQVCIWENGQEVLEFLAKPFSM